MSNEQMYLDALDRLAQREELAREREALNAAAREAGMKPMSDKEYYAFVRHSFFMNGYGF